MTKRRAIYGSAATSISLARCCPEAQLLFDRLVSQADDQGRLQGDPMLVKAQCMPLIDRATVKRIDTWLGELADNGMIERYESAGQALIQIVKWWPHQNWMRHIYPSRWPAPDGWEDRAKGAGEQQDDGNLPPDNGKVPQSAAELPTHDGTSESGVSGGDVSVSETNTSRVRGDDEPDAPPATLLDHSLSRTTTTHFDLTTVRCSKGGEAMYADLLRRYGFDVVRRAQYNVGAQDNTDRGFIGRVKTQCKRIADAGAA